MSQSWRILMLVFVAARKGAYWRAIHFARQLVQLGHQVTVLAMSPAERFRFKTSQDHGVTVVESPDLLWGPLRSGWDPWDCLNRIRWLRDQEFDLVHTFDARPTNLLPALYCKHRKRIPLVMDWEDWLGQGGSVEERTNPLLRAILRPVETYFEQAFRIQADGTTVICSTLHAKAIRLGVPPETITFLRDGADVDGLHPLDRETCRRELGLPADVPLIGYIGAIFYRDARLMAQAFDIIQAAKPSARLCLIGYVNFPLEDMVAEPKSVIRTGFIHYQQVNQYIAASDLCWLPYVDSGANQGRWPMKLNDYMSVGRPTVATAVGDVTEIFQTQAVGLLAEPTPPDLAAKALRLLNDPAYSAVLGCNARRVAEESFDWRKLTKELEKLYGKVLADRHHLTV